MKYHLRITTRAREDIAAIADYFAADNLDAAFRFLEAIDQLTGHLTQFPHIGCRRSLAPERYPELRSIPVHGFLRYLMFYQTSNEYLDVIRVVDGTRQLERLFPH